MNEKTTNILRWVLGGLVAFIFIGSAIGKLTADPKGLEEAAKMGMQASHMKILATIEIVAAVLFLIPRTGILGTLLLAAYMGGAIATHLTHGDSVMAPALIQAFVWIVAVFRFPELRTRLFGA